MAHKHYKLKLVFKCAIIINSNAINYNRVIAENTQFVLSLVADFILGELIYLTWVGSDGSREMKKIEYDRMLCFIIS
jgi:hypothetical protein